MRHSSIRSVYAYWNQLRAHRPAPFRTEVDPRALARELGDLFLLEGVREDMRFRLAGSRIVQALGDTMTGRRFSLLWEDAARADAKEAITTVLEAEEPMLLGIRLSEPDIRPEPMPASRPASRPASWLNLRPLPGPRIERRAPPGLAGEMLLLPLRHPAGCGRRVFGAMALFDPPAMPRTSPAQLVISGGRMLGRDALPRRGFDLVPGGVERRAHLLVLKGDREP